MRLREYTRVWGDTVCLIQLLLSLVMGIAISMGMYMGINFVLASYTDLEPKIITGYALMGGILGCFISGVISGRKFKPKRELIDGTEQMDLERVLAEAGSSIEEETKALINADKETIEEMEGLELYALLSLIPEGSANYKAEYRQRVERKNND